MGNSAEVGLAPRGQTAPPSGPIHCTAEYEPTDGILIRWSNDPGIQSIQSQMGGQITTVGNADLYVVVTGATQQSSATTQLQGAGTDMARVRFVTHATDTIWIRDYGPRYIYEGNCRAIVDHTYNRPRPNDDAFPQYFSTYKRHAFYELPLVHGGGNFHLSALGDSMATRLIDNENPSLTEAQIHDFWRDYQNLDTTFYNPYPQTVDSTQHIDMWTLPVGDREIMVSDWPFDPGSAQDDVCDNAAVDLTLRGYDVHRVPARSVNGTHYTYTNAVVVNNLVLIPSYTNAQVAPHNAEALADYQAALPGKTIVPINCQAIVTSAGVMHCIVMHIPTPLGGANPTAYLKSLRGCAALVPGTQADIRWISDDDLGVQAVDLLLSTDGGASYPNVIASGIADSGLYAWTVPDLPTNRARVRVVVHDADGNSGNDDSPDDLAIGPPGTGGPVPPDLLLARKTGPDPAYPDIRWTFPNGGGAVSWNLYEGPLGTYYSTASALCGRDAADPLFRDNGDSTSSYTLTPARGSHWYLVSASNCTAESALVNPTPAWACGPSR